jgi:hypothetical protein
MGQTVTVKLTSEATPELQKGTMLIGKVDQVQNAATAGTSKMSITFDQARLKNGKEVPIKTMLLGVYSPQNQFESGMSPHFLPVQPATVSDNKTITQEPGALKNISMESSGQSNTSAVFTSTNHNIKLDHGTVLQVAIAPMPESGSNAASSATTGAMQ